MEQGLHPRSFRSSPGNALKQEHLTVYDANGNRASATIHGKHVTAHYTLDDRLTVYGDNTYRYEKHEKG